MENTRHNQTPPSYLNILNSSLFSIAQICSAAFHPLLQSLISRLEKHRGASVKSEGVYLVILFCVFICVQVFCIGFLFGLICLFVCFSPSLTQSLFSWYNQNDSPGNLPLIIHFKADLQPVVCTIHPEVELKCELMFILWVHFHQYLYLYED